MAKSHASLNKSNYVNILASFDEKLFSPEFSNPKSFEEVRERAFKGSDFEKKEEKPFLHFLGSAIGILWLLSFVPIIYIIVLAFRATNEKKHKGRARLGSVSDRKIKDKIKKSKDDFRRDPPKHSLHESYLLLNYAGEAGLKELIAALILNWIRQGYLQFGKKEVSSFFGLLRKDESILGGFDDHVPSDPLENRLFMMMREASGSDKLLEEKEFYRWSKKEYKRVLEWHVDYLQEGDEALEQRGSVGQKREKKSLGLFPYLEREFTDRGLNEVGDLLGLKNFLESFTLVSERETMEVEVWEEHLVYAALFGIADKVAEELEKHQPTFFQESAYGNDYQSTIGTIAMVNHMSSAMTRGSTSASSSGGGGFSSSGGGGGFSGGGSGGGFR